MNEQIRITPIRLIDENDNQVGIVETVEALRRARDAGMDLVEVAPTDRPPVCRLMDYGKWKYRQNKKEQKARQRHHGQQLKEVRMRPKTDVHDLDYKVKHARTFLEEGNRVQFTIMFRGREMAHQDIGMQKMQAIATKLADLAKVELAPKMAGRRMTMIVMPVKRAAGEKPAAAAPAAGATAPPAGVAAPVAAAAPPAGATAPPAAAAAPPAESQPAAPGAAPGPPTG